MTDHDDGGPAFPCDLLFPDEVVQHQGLSIRDHFAGCALAGGLEQGARDSMDVHWWHQPSLVAERAYAIADAMLRERAK